MLTYSNKAFISQDYLLSVVVEEDLGDDDGLFDFTATSNDVEASNYLLDNEDSLYNKSVLLASQPTNEELGDNNDAAISSDGNFSQSIEHAIGDHQLKGMLSYLTSAIRTLTLAS